MTKRKQTTKPKRPRRVSDEQEAEATTSEVVTGALVVSGAALGTVALVLASPVGAPILAAGAALAARNHLLAHHAAAHVLKDGLESVSSVAGDVGKAIFRRFR